MVAGGCGAGTPARSRRAFNVAEVSVTSLAIAYESDPKQAAASPTSR